jgi:hypothetical protein
MSIAKFSSSALAITPNHSTLPENCRRAILAIEGDHVDDSGRSHRMDADYIKTLGLNTNKQISLGRIVNAFENHRIDSSAKFGCVMGTVDVRPVTEDDLPYPEATDMLGKMAIFGVMKFNRLLDKVKSGAIKALSPGIDLAKQIIIEVSEVPIAAMPGVALFRYGRRQRTGRVTRPDAEGVEGLDRQKAEDWSGDPTRCRRGEFDRRSVNGENSTSVRTSAFCLPSSALFSYAQLKEQDAKFNEERDRAIGFLDLYLKFCSIEQAKSDPDECVAG